MKRNPVNENLGRAANSIYRNDGDSTSVATLDGIIAKSGISLLLVSIFSVLSAFLIPIEFLAPALIVSIFTSIAIVIFIFKSRITFNNVLIFTIFEGVVIGSISKFLELRYEGIIYQAIFATLIVAGLVLAFYKFSGLRVTSRFRKIVTIATLGLAVLYLGNIVVSLFGVNTGLVEFGSKAGIISMIVSIIAIVLATFNLIIDFDNIETLIKNGASKDVEWAASLGLIITIMWMYVELLRVISYFRN